LKNSVEKRIYHRDIVRMKISIPYDFKISKISNNISEINMNSQKVSDNFEIKFYQPTLLSSINYNIFLRLLKDSFILAHVVGIFYFSYKILEKYFLNRRNKDKSQRNQIKALPSGDSTD
jgi:hypothetical protein